jgi:hypothetical protein
MTKYQYQSADGGPHIVLPDALRGAWAGGAFTGSGDYARACAVTGRFGLIPVGSANALVLAGSPGMVAFAPAADGGAADVIILEEWANTNLDGLIDRALAATPTKAMTDTGKTWQVSGGGLTMIFAGDKPGDTAYGEERTPVPDGTYRLFEGLHKPKPLESVVICRLVPLAPQSAPSPR